MPDDAAAQVFVGGPDLAGRLVFRDAPRPEAAATQIAGLDDDMAAAVLSQLNPGKASAIFNELVPERATKLAALIAATPAATAADKATDAPPAGDKR